MMHSTDGTRSYRRVILWIVVGFSITLMLTGCALMERAQLGPGGHEESLIERLEHAAPSDGEEEARGEPNVVIDALLSEVDAVQVQALVHGEPFRTLARRGEITQFPCSSCHIEPLAELQATLGDSEPHAHWDIVVEHANASAMSCTTCHNPDDMDTLHTLTGQAVDFDHSYQVCAQCHSGIAEDWVGGAHGKRVAGWAPPRVVQNCVGCHNPHQPAWDIRWPAVTSGGSDD